MSFLGNFVGNAVAGSASTLGSQLTSAGLGVTKNVIGNASAKKQEVKTVNSNQSQVSQGNPAYPPPGYNSQPYPNQSYPNQSYPNQIPGQYLNNYGPSQPNYTLPNPVTGQPMQINYMGS